MVEKKKKQEGLSWIDEIILGEESLDRILNKEQPKKEDTLPPFISSGGSSFLDEIFGNTSKDTSETDKTEKKKAEEDSPLPTETAADFLGQILGSASEEKPPKKLPPKKKEEKSIVPPLPESEETSADFLKSILGESEGKSSPELGFGVRDILTASAEEPEYATGGKVLDAYGNVRILRVKGEAVPIYEIKMPKLSKEELELIKQVRERAITEIHIDPATIPDPEERRRVFITAVKKLLRETAPHYSEGRLEFLADYIVQYMIGYGKLDPLVRDDNLEEIMVIGTNRPVYVWHRRFNMCKTNIVFEDEKEILNIIERIAREVGRRIDQQSPLLDARLPDGSRVNATIPPISLDGPTITIRKFKKDPLTIIDLIKYGTMSSEIAAFLWVLVDGLGVKPANILVAGGTGSGKTTTLNSLGMFIPPSERVISIEDTAELQLPVEHWVRLETRPPNLEGKGEITMDDLVKNTLRMRPDRIIVGEVRGPEARTMFTAMNTGHDGCMGTIHSNSARETIVRLESPPMNVPKIMIPALDIIIMQVRFHSRKKGTIRRVTEIAEVSGLEGESIQLNTLYKYDPAKDELVPTGVPSRTINILARHTGMSVREIELEIEKRKIILEWMMENGIRSIEKVGHYIRQFYIDEESLIKKISAESTVETRRELKSLI